MHLGGDLALDRALDRERGLIDAEAEAAQALAVEVDADLGAAGEVVGDDVGEALDRAQVGEQALRVRDGAPRVVRK